MSGDARNFNNIETRAVINYSFLQGKASKKIHAILTETLGKHAPSYATVKNWVAQFKRDDFSNCNAPHPGRPKTVTTPEIIDQIHELILEDRRISAKSIVEQLGFSRERVGHAEALREMGPEMSEREKKKSRVPVVWAILEFFLRDLNDFLSGAIGDHGGNLVTSLWPGDKATFNGMAA